MGDVLTLIEKAQETIDLQKAQDFERKLMANQFTLEDFFRTNSTNEEFGSLGTDFRFNTRNG